MRVSRQRLGFQIKFFALEVQVRVANIVLHFHLGVSSQGYGFEIGFQMRDRVQIRAGISNWDLTRHCQCFNLWLRATVLNYRCVFVCVWSKWCRRTARWAHPAAHSAAPAAGQDGGRPPAHAGASAAPRPVDRRPPPRRRPRSYANAPVERNAGGRPTPPPSSWRGPVEVAPRKAVFSFTMYLINVAFVTIVTRARTRAFWKSIN